MSLSILGGIAKGQVLKVPDGHHIRPIAIRLKRRMFDSWQDFTGETFWDACGGSGAVGLEAWSRGASKVFFTEKDRRVYQILKNNALSLQSKFKENENRDIKLIQGSALNFPFQFEEKLDHLFFAPPYELHQLYRDFLSGLKKLPAIENLWVESDDQKGLSEEILVDYFEIIHKTYRQGTTFLIRGQLNQLKS